MRATVLRLSLLFGVVGVLFLGVTPLAAGVDPPQFVPFGADEQWSGTVRIDHSASETTAEGGGCCGAGTHKEGSISQVTTVTGLDSISPPASGSGALLAGDTTATGSYLLSAYDDGKSDAFGIFNCTWFHDDSTSSASESVTSHIPRVYVTRLDNGEYHLFVQSIFVVHGASTSTNWHYEGFPPDCQRIDTSPSPSPYQFELREDYPASGSAPLDAEHYAGSVTFGPSPVGDIGTGSYTMTWDLHRSLATNRAPVVVAGPSVTGRSGESRPLTGSVNDDGLPNPPARISSLWSVVSGPQGGTATFADAQAAATTVTFSRPGHYVLQLSASDSKLTTAATTSADIVDHYRVEMKAWIPQTQIVDPYELDASYAFPKLLLPALGQPLRNCLAAVFAPGANPLTTIQISSTFTGNGHSDFGVFQAGIADYKLRTFVEFDYDGSKILNFASDTDAGQTVRLVAASRPGRPVSVCRQTGFADPAFATRGSRTTDRTFEIGVSGYNPLTPRTAADWTQGCAALTVLYPPSVNRLCLALLAQVPLTPSIDSHAHGSILADGSLSFTYTTDFFPSHGVAVKRNDEAPWDAVINDASCVPTTGFLGAANVLVRLQGDLPRNVGALSKDSADTACDPAALASFVPPVEAVLHRTIFPLTEPALLIANSYFPAH